MKKIDNYELRMIEAGKFYFGDEIGSDNFYGFFDTDFILGLAVNTDTKCFYIAFILKEYIHHYFGIIRGKFASYRTVGEPWT